jgi:hypothetical protein
MPQPRRVQPEGVNSMRVGGWVMLAWAGWELIERFVLSFWLNLDSGDAVGYAIFEAALGVAMLQGSEAARKIVLVLTFLGALAAGLLLLGLSLTDFWHLWPILASALAATVGVFLLTLWREASVPALALGVTLVVGGWIGSVVSSIALVGAVDIGTIRMIREWSAPERTLKADDVEMKVPPRWVALKPGNPIPSAQPALATLASTAIMCTAQLYREVRSFTSTDTLELYLDALAKQKAADVQDFEAGARVDTRIGAAVARRMKVSWRLKGARFVGYVTAWRDADVFYHLFVRGAAVVTKKVEEEAAALEAASVFAAPRAAFLRDVAPRIRDGCPLLTDNALLEVGRALPADAPPEAYCRMGYRLALTGEPGMTSEYRERLRTSMRRLFDAIPRAQIDAFGRYVERLLAGGNLTPAEDKQLAASIRAAMAGLSPAVQEELRSSFGMAINMGLFSNKFK